MKRILIFLIVGLPLFTKAQLNIEPNYQYVIDSIYWEAADTITNFQGTEVLDDSVMFVFATIPSEVDLSRYSIEIEVINDSVYLRRTKALKAEVLRSRKIIIYRKVFRNKLTIIPNEPEDIMVKALKYAKDINNNNAFWSYPIIDSIVNDEYYLNLKK